jgi:Uma2 family endonuclease
MAVVQRLLTPDDVAGMQLAGELNREEPFELVDGEIVWLAFPSLFHARVVGAICVLVAPFVERIGGVLFTDGAGFRVGTDFMNLRGPDLALVTRERRHIVPNDATWGSEAPDLCVEVLSPEQGGEAYARPKTTEYFAAGAKVVWLVNPQNRTLRVYEAGKAEFTTYPETEEVTLDAIAPGFRARVSRHRASVRPPSVLQIAIRDSTSLLIKRRSFRTSRTPPSPSC